MAPELLIQGVDLQRQGRLDEAAQRFEALIAADASDAEATYQLSLTRAMQGRVDDGVLLALRAAALAPASGRIQAHAGALLTVVRRGDEAAHYFERAIALDPGRPEVHNNYGALLRAMGKLDPAIEQFKLALSAMAAYADARLNLAKTLVSRGQHEAAGRQFQLLLEADPNSVELLVAMGTAVWRTAKTDEAEAYFRRALAIDPAAAEAWGHLGNVLVERGEMDEAVAAMERAISLAPARTEFYRFLAQARPAAITSLQLSSLEALAAGASALPVSDRMDVHFALGKIYASRGEEARSFPHFVSANRYKRSLIEYDEAETARSFERIPAVFTPEFLERHAGAGDPSQLPVFIFGMPRSGTTLIEQILASHPLVYAAGELGAIEDVATRVLMGTQRITEDAMLNVSDERLRAIGREYVEQVSAMAGPQVERITDKMPANFRYAGLIHLVLPRARMIHARRDPVDTCLSCFTHYFEGDQPWAYDLAELGRYYRGYRNLMDYWTRTLPEGSILDVQYEDVVADLETQARRIVEFCGLPWDERCLEFYRTARPVRTASAAQVRRPIYKSSVGKGVAYGDLLDPLLRELGQK